MEGRSLSEFLKPTQFIDFESESIRACLSSLGCSELSVNEQARVLFSFVRDEIKYEFLAKLEPQQYVASHILRERKGFCVQKAVLLCALARASGIPAALVFCDVLDESLSKKTVSAMKTNILYCHGLAALWLDGRWLKVDPSLSPEIVIRKRFVPVDFDGVNDALHATKTLDGKPHAQYINFHGLYADVPFEKIVSVYRSAYAGADMGIR